MTSLDVVITTYNRHEPLNRCLEALRHQTFAPARVIVVDDCSEPPVVGTIPSELVRDLPLSVHRTTRNSGPARGRNKGVRESRSERILFIDDDIVAAPELLERHARWHELEPSLAVIGPLAEPPDWHPTAWNLWEARKLAVEYRRMMAGAYAPGWSQFFTGNASVARHEFIRAGGFDERFTRAEDIELGVRLARSGCRFVFDPGAIGWHYATRTRDSWLRIPREYAKFDVAIAALHPELRWREVIAGHLRSRHPLTRAATAVLAAVHGERPVAGSATRAAGLTHRMGVSLLAQPLLSLAFALEYGASSRQAGASFLGTPAPSALLPDSQIEVQSRGTTGDPRSLHETGRS